MGIFLGFDNFCGHGAASGFGVDCRISVILLFLDCSRVIGVLSDFVGVAMSGVGFDGGIFSLFGDNFKTFC